MCEKRERSRILIVDSDEEMRGMLSSMLSRKNFMVEEADDGIKALEKIDQISPDIILLDVILPGINGFEVYKRLKENTKTQGIPIIFCTSMRMTEFSERKDIVGEYIEKPFEVNILYERINKALEQSMNKDITGNTESDLHL